MELTRAMPPRTATPHWATMQISQEPPDATPKEGAHAILTSGDTGSPEVTFRNRDPTEDVGGMVSIKIN